jgi:hypothetical protein
MCLSKTRYDRSWLLGRFGLATNQNVIEDIVFWLAISDAESVGFVYRASVQSASTSLHQAR